MKKVFITIFALFYLVSSLGFASVHHYCHMMQASMQTGVNECCCSREHSRDADSCFTPEKVDEKKSCCDSDNNVQSTVEVVLVSIQTNCCETEAEYNQIDISTLVKIVDANSDVSHNSIDFFRCAHGTKLKAPNNTFTYPDKSIHLNLPLLI